MTYWRAAGAARRATVSTTRSWPPWRSIPSNLNECRIAIDEFVALQIGIALPLTAQGQTEWTVVGDGRTGHSAPGSWGGHGIPYREYDGETFKCVTWGAELLLTVPFHQAYSQEAHVVVTKEMLDKTGVGPSGVAWDELIADIKVLTSAPAVEAGRGQPSAGGLAGRS